MLPNGPFLLAKAMTDQTFPITPPSELVQQWVAATESNDCIGALPTNFEQRICTAAARWGADQQLEQDGRWLDTHALFTSNLTVTPSGDALRRAMRPKPPSLKEQALEAWQKSWEARYLKREGANIIRRALEALDD
jgi:hypothetical protein